jgi:hypothetical protein
MVVTAMNTPMRALARDGVSDTTPTMAASTATMTEKKFGESMRLATGRMPCRYASGVRPDHRMATPKITAAAIAIRKPQNRAASLEQAFGQARRAGDPDMQHRQIVSRPGWPGITRPE